MIRILVCWEDEYHAKLDLCLKRALHVVGDKPSSALFFAGVRGNGGFEPYVRRDWPKAARVGLPKSGGPIDYLVCVADADRAQDCCGVDRPPPAPAPTAEWVTRANELWTAQLQAAATLSAERVIGRFLRWNQESFLIAGHDIESALARLGCANTAAIAQHLATCSPSPRTTADALFTDTFRHSSQCLDDLIKRGGGQSTKKGSILRDDALDEISKVGIPQLCARAPDLASLAELVQRLATDPP